MKKLHSKKKIGTKSGLIAFVHGASSSSRVFDAILDSSKIPFSMMSVDLQGHGASWRSSNPVDYSIEAYKRTLLHELSGKEPLLLVGNSLGGHLTLEMASELNNLRGIVLMGTAPLRKPLNAEEAFHQNDHLQPYFIEESSNDLINKAIDEAVANKATTPLLYKDFKQTDLKVRSRLAHDFANPDMFSEEAEIFIQFDKPKYVIHGRQDPLVNLKYIKGLCDLSQTCAELIVYENCGHYPSIERTDLFINTIAKWASNVFNSE